MSVLIAILIVGILIIVHEAGHFWAARLTGIAVREFSVGFGPKLLGWKSKKHETVFTLRLIPMGGFCAFYGEDDVTGKHQSDPRAYNRQSVWKRMFTVAMGPGMNFILAFVVMALFFCFVGIPTSEEYPQIFQVVSGSPAEAAGLEAEDRILEVGGVSAQTDTEALRSTLNADSVQMLVERNGERLTFSVHPLWSEADGRYMCGISFGYAYTFRPASLWQSAAASWDECVYTSGTILRLLKGLVTTGEGLDQTSGIVGAVSVISQQISADGFYAFIGALVMLSINLGVMNLLPIPGLDGSRLIFQMIEAVCRKPVNPKYEAMIHLAGMVFLFAVMIFFTYRDILNLFV